VARFLLIRHGETDFAGTRIAGRMPGVHLNANGRRQAQELAERLQSLGVEAVYSGPLERVQETAAPLCQQLGLACQIAVEFDEIEFGDWTNCTLDQLSTNPHWQRFNSARSTTAPPGGEWMLEVQARAIRRLEQLRQEHQCVAVVTHADVIRAIVTHSLGMPLDLFLRIEIYPASISVLELNDWGPQLRLLNGARSDCYNSAEKSR
jgi:broad specificity phosphatase PhoE